MRKERPQPEDSFGFTENEKLFYRVSDERFRQLLDDEQTTIHQVELSTNDYGQFLFVSTSRPRDQEKVVCMTFWGYGRHEFRERWLTEEWFYYRTSPSSKTMQENMTREEALELINQRREAIAPYIDKSTQSKRGELFEIIADLSDDDAAITELDDLGDLFDDRDDS